MQLSDIEVRILGCLMEKEATTPDNYPLSLNALTSACNQLTNRLAEFTDAADVEAVVRELISRELVVEMARQPGQKEIRYAHLLSGAPTHAPAEMQVEIAAAEPRRDRIAELEASLDEVRREL